MKTVLELNLQAKLDKNFYKIRKNAIVANISPEQEYPIDSL